jgi:rare lipoprotein A
MRRRQLTFDIRGAYAVLRPLGSAVQEEAVREGKLMARKLMLMLLRQRIGIPLICSALGMVGCAEKPPLGNLLPAEPTVQEADIEMASQYAPLELQTERWYSENGLASYYGKEFQGKKTASGQRFSATDMTAAHRKLPLGTKVMVENLETGEKTEVKITDRGPYADQKRRIIDLSKAAANSIGLVEQGVGRVRVTVTEGPAKAQKTSEDEETYFEVHVGAFEDGEQAHTVLGQVKPWFPDAYIAPRDGPVGEYYRIRIGPFKTQKEAEGIANGLKRGGHRVFLDEVPESALSAEAAREVSYEGGEKPNMKKR